MSVIVIGSLPFSRCKDKYQINFVGNKDRKLFLSFALKTANESEAEISVFYYASQTPMIIPLH